jgi:hypothetical protein
MPTSYYDLYPDVPNKPFPQDAFKDATAEVVMEYLLSDIDPDIDTTGLNIREIASLVEHRPLGDEARSFLAHEAPELLKTLDQVDKV